MVKDVQDFRDKHEDWRSLADFFLTHVSRRYKKNKHLDSKTKMSVNVRAGNEMMKTYLTNKLGKDTENIKEDKADSSLDKTVKKKSKKVCKTEISSDNEDVKPEGDSECDSKHSSDSDESICNEKGSERLSDGDDGDVEEEQELSEEENNSDNSDNSDMSDGEDLKVRGETVVKKLDMNDLITSNEGDIPGFLISQPEEDNVSKPNKLKDSFFMGSDGESFNDEVDDDNSDSDESEIDMDDKRTSGKNSIRTTFVGALNSEKNRNRKFDNFRGRGRGRGDRFNRNNSQRQYENYNGDRSRGRGQYGSYGYRGRGRGQFGRNEDQGSGRGRSNFRRDDERQQRFEKRGRGGYPGGNSRNPREYQRSGSRGRGNQFQSKNTE